MSLATVAVAAAQPRSGPTPPRQAPALPSTGHQSEAIDLNEGKTPPQMFASDCAVCHQRPNGLSKGRSAGQLAGFLRQHYTTGTQQAGIMAAFLTSGGNERGAPAPARAGVREQAPAEPRPPASIFGRRSQPDAEEAKPDAAKPEAAKPEAEAPRRRREEARKPPAERPLPGARHAKPEIAKPETAKPEIAKPEPSKPEIAEPAAKPAASETEQAKAPVPDAPAESKPAENKPAEAKPAEAPASEPQVRI